MGQGYIFPKFSDHFTNKTVAGYVNSIMQNFKALIELLSYRSVHKPAAAIEGIDAFLKFPDRRSPIAQMLFHHAPEYVRSRGCPLELTSEQANENAYLEIINEQMH